MKNLTIACAAIAALLASPAMAADMPVKAQVYKTPVAAAGHNWTGFYVGANAGGAWSAGDANISLPSVLATGAGTGPAGDSGSAVSAVASTHVSSSGFTGGVQAGYNWQFNNVVLGVEADFNALNLDNSNTVVGRSVPPGPLWTNTVQTSVNMDWLVTARPRIGYAWNSLMVYGTGGLAVTRLKLFQSQVNVITPSPPNTEWLETGSSNVTKAGWAVGGGFEYALSNNWSVKAEYIYADFGSETVVGISTNAPGNLFNLGGQSFTHKFDLHLNIARAGINYKF